MAMSLLPDALANAHLWPLFLAALLPWILYLLDRRRARRVDWPAVRFFLVKRTSRVRWIRLREFLLIVVRTLLIATIVYAFLRPTVDETTTLANASVDGERTPRAFVVVVDSSASMTLEHGSPAQSSFTRAKIGVSNALRDAREGDNFVILIGDARFVRLDRSPGTPGDVAELLRSTTPGGHGFDLANAIDAALSIAEDLREPIVDVFVFTDLQTTSKRDEPSRWKFFASRWSGSDERTRLTIVDCGTGEAPNARVTSISTDETLAGTDAPTRFHIEAEVPEALAHQTWTLRLLIDDEPLFARELDTTTSPSAETTMEHPFPRAGVYRLEAQIVSREGADGFRLDDRRFEAIEVHDHVDVVIRGGEEGALDSAYYLELALFPKSRDSTPEDVLFRPRVIEEVTTASLRAARVLILGVVHDLRDAERSAIEMFLSRGGGLLIVAGSDAPPSQLGGLTPAPILEQVTAENAALSIGTIATSHPALSPFADSENGDLTRISVRRFAKLGPLRENTRTLARISETDPWIVEGSVESGRIVLLTTSATPEDSNLPNTPLFVPLIHGLARYLASDASTDEEMILGSGLQGRDLAIRLSSKPEGRSVSATSPSGDTRTLEVIETNGTRSATWLNADEVGFYHAVSPGGTRRIEPVNVSREESELTRLTADVLEQVRELTPRTRLVRDLDSAESTTRKIVKRREQWPFVLGGALLLVFLELALHASIARSRVDPSAGRER